MGGLRCRACRRYVLRRSHVILLLLLGVALVVGVLEVVTRLPE
jgi:heme A synthase